MKIKEAIDTIKSMIARGEKIEINLETVQKLLESLHENQISATDDKPFVPLDDSACEDGTIRKSNVYRSFSKGELAGRRLQVYQVIQGYPEGVDCHTIIDCLSADYSVETSLGCVSARVNELLQSNLIKISSIREGRFGKKIAYYSINEVANVI